jgi:geranylgeranyl pyrophosphate synthase
MCTGEVLQYERLHDCAVSLDDYLAVAQRKTASLFESCCGLSALITGQPEVVVAALRTFGETLGIMFQVRDDLKDWTEDESQAGKPVNEDFAEGIYTIPAIHAFADETVGDRLRELAALERPTHAELGEARRLVEQARGIAYARAYLARLAQQAADALSALPEGPHRDALLGVVSMVASD